MDNKHGYDTSDSFNYSKDLNERNAHSKCLKSTNFEGFHRAKPLAIAKHCCVPPNSCPCFKQGHELGGKGVSVTQLKVQHIAESRSQNNCGTTKS